MSSMNTTSPRIPGSQLIPLGELPSRMSELDSADEIVIHCKSGIRSAKALRQLQKAGFAKLFNVEGGISAWADRGQFRRPNLGQAPLAHHSSPNEDGCERDDSDAHQTERARFRNDLEDIRRFRL